MHHSIKIHYQSALPSIQGPELSIKGKIADFGVKKTLQFGTDSADSKANPSPIAASPSEPGTVLQSPTADPGVQQQTPVSPPPPKTFWEKVRSVWDFGKSFVEFLRSDNITIAKGLFFKKVVPLLFAMSIFIPVYGIPLSIGGIFLSWPSGMYGDRVLNRLREKLKAQNDGSEKNLDVNPMMENISRLDELLDHPDKAKTQTELMEIINKIIDDALDVSRFPFLKKIINVIKPAPGNFFGRVLLNYNRFAHLANVNNKVAEEKSLGKATVAGIKGSMEHILYFKVLPTIGKWIEKGSNFAPGPLKWIFKLVGWSLEYFGFLKLAADVATTSAPQSTQSEPNSK